MTDKKIKFSIVLPAYNVEQYIIEALECLGGQDYPEYEVIVVDDCATDATRGAGGAVCGGERRREIFCDSSAAESRRFRGQKFRDGCCHGGVYSVSGSG